MSPNSSPEFGDSTALLGLRTRRQAFFLILALGVLNALTPFSIDLYLPAFPQIARDLRTEVPRVSLSVAIYFIGFALGQIVYGPLLDRFGRKRPLYVGLLIYILASIGCMTAHSVESLIAFRFLSALGGSAASVASTSMVRDYFPAKDAAKVFSMLMLVLSISPFLAPSVGTLIVNFWGWRSLFGVLTGIALLDVGLVAFALPTAYLPDPSVSLNFSAILRVFGDTIKIRRFWVYTFSGALSFAGLFVYVSASPGIFMGGFKVDANLYSAIFAFVALGMIGGGQLNHLLVRRAGSLRVFRATLICQVAVAVAFVGCALGMQLGLATTVAFFFVLLVCAGITYPNAAALALEPFSKNVGSASALLGFIQLGIGALVAAGVGIVDDHGALPTAVVMAASAMLGLVVLWLGRDSAVPRRGRSGNGNL